MKYDSFDKEALIQILKDKDREIERLKYYATMDSMTNVLNRRAGMMKLNQVLALSQNGMNNAVVCYIDVDNLKTVNDRFGHYEGDLLLVTVSRILKENIRSTDIIFRIGGDEFVIIFPRTREKEVVMIMERIQREMEHINKYGVNQYAIGISYGLLLICEDTEISIEEILSKADKKMYERKYTKNKCIKK